MNAVVSAATIVRDLLPLLGVLLGAGLQYIFSRSAEIKRHERTLRIDAYSDYLRSVGEAETMKMDPQVARRSDVLARAIAAKARVCVHGSAAVVSALAKFEGDSEPGLTPQKRKYFLEFVDAIRKDVGAHGDLNTEGVAYILFGEDA